VAQFFDVVLGQRACREFTDDPVSDEELEKIMLAATFAPSVMNHQPWVFVVVRANEGRQQLTTIGRELWEHHGGREAFVGLMPTELLDDVDLGFIKTMETAPVFIVVAGDTSITPEDQLSYSIYPAVQNLLLAANALGLGSALTTMATQRAAEVQKLTGLPPSILPMAIVPIGRPARKLGKPRRQPVGQKAFRENYSNAW
jgi:nitroreductase